jgi:hypothetical protein
VKRSAPAIFVVFAVLIGLLAAGCGGGSSGGSSSTAPGGGDRTTPKATSPNAPAGSKVVSCAENRMEMEALRATEVGCAAARSTMERWQNSRACTLGDSSRSSCSLADFRCQAVKVEKGASVSCAGPQGDVSFIAKTWPAKKFGVEP